MANHETYYVPAQSKWPIIASVALLLTVGMFTCMGKYFKEVGW